MRACRKASSVWPGRLDAGRRTTKPRRSRLRRPAATRSRPRSRSTGSSQKTRPTTAARCSTRLSAVARASMRAASSACRLSGSAPVPEPARCRTSSSRNSGLPSALARTSSPSSSGSRPVGVRLASSSRLWPSVSGRREMEARSSPAWPPKPGWVSASSGRVVATTSRAGGAGHRGSRVSSSSGPASGGPRRPAAPVRRRRRRWRSGARRGPARRPPPLARAVPAGSRAEGPRRWRRARTGGVQLGPHPAEDLAQAGRASGLGRLQRVGERDAAGLAQHLAKGPVGDPAAGGQAAAP